MQNVWTNSDYNYVRFFYILLEFMFSVEQMLLEEMALLLSRSLSGGPS